MNKFNIFTGMLKAYELEDRPMIRTTASSSVVDMAKDEILPAAIFAMADRAKNNLTIYLNHERTVPEDVFGSVQDATVVKRGTDAAGMPIYDLDLDIAVNDVNPRALQTYQSIKKGTQLGTSIGAIVRHATKKKDGGLRIDELDLMEASIVSIPANPRSWVHYAMKSFNGTPEEETVLDEEKEAEAPVVETVEAEVPPITTTEVEPDKEAATVTVEVDGHGSVMVDTSRKPQEASADPETGLLDETADGDDEAIGDGVTRDAPPENLAEFTLNLELGDLDVIKEALTSAVTRIEMLSKALAVAEQERDDAVENFAAAKQIIERIAKLPIGPKATYRKAAEDFRTKFAGVYSDEFLKFLEK